MTALAPMQVIASNITVVSQVPVISKETGEPSTAKLIVRGEVFTKRINTGVNTMTPMNTLRRSRFGVGRSR
jgi:hypothetical protein